MKLSTRDIVFLYTTLNDIAEKPIVEQAPIDVKFILVRNARAIQPIAEDFDKSRQEIMLANSESINDSNERKASKEQLAYINGEIAKLEQIELEVVLTPIPLAKLESLNLNLTELSGLYPIISQEEAY